jgi:protein-tyrosine phosphatase
MDLDQITPRLFVGSCPVKAEDIDRLNYEVGVTAVVNVQTEEDFAYWGIEWGDLEAHYRQSGIEVRRVPVRDFDPDALRRSLPQCVGALAELLEDGHTVYVHCSAGINRSPSTVIAYVHWIEGWDLDEAIAHVAKCRSCDPYLAAIRQATEDRRRGSNDPQLF